MNAKQMQCTIHFYYCALVAFRMAYKYDTVRSPIAKNRFFLHWLKQARKSNIFDRGVTADIDWLRKQIVQSGLLMETDALVAGIYYEAIKLNG